MQSRFVQAFLRQFGNVHHDAPIAHAIDLMMRAVETGTLAVCKAATGQVALTLQLNQVLAAT